MLDIEARNATGLVRRIVRFGREQIDTIEHERTKLVRHLREFF